MKMVDTKSGGPFRVRVNRTGRRTYSREYQLEVVEECDASGASVAAVALSHRINANLVRRWIVQHRKGRLVREPRATAALLPVVSSGAQISMLLDGIDWRRPVKAWRPEIAAAEKSAS